MENFVDWMVMILAIMFGTSLITMIVTALFFDKKNKELEKQVQELKEKHRTVSLWYSHTLDENVYLRKKLFEFKIKTGELE